MNDTDRYVRRAGDGPQVVDVTPESAGWAWSGLRVVELGPDAPSVTWALDRDEALVVPLRGGVMLAVELPDPSAAEADRTISRTVTLTGRASVFAGPTDVAYLPLGAVVTVTAAPGASVQHESTQEPPAEPRTVRVALATARASRALPLQVLPAASARVDLRGAGDASRRVTNYTLDTEVAIDHLLVCEVVTPGGNWSSYPPHKHDVHSDADGSAERKLEEIYYFEVADGPDGTPGVGYHRTYGTPERPIDVLAEVRTGDTALVPHGFHGPCTAPPGFDLYYLNVMAGPATDGRWLSTDDPALAWVRATWPDQPVDPRLTHQPTSDVKESR